MPRPSTLAAILALALLSAPAAGQPGEVSAPVVKSHVDAQYPASALREGKHAQVVLLVTVDATGHVANVTVAESGGPALDESAMAAMRQWTFEPARRGGVAVAARIRVPFHFAPPSAAPDVVPHGHDTVAGGVEAPRPPPLDETVQEVHVEGVSRAPQRGASDVRFDQRGLSASPKGSGADVLSVAPGVYVAHPEGDAIAQRIYLRGFDAEHGQDVELRVAGIPINQSSHIHGQGYADLGLVIPETVRQLRVLEGVYDPRQGDFAVAGSAELDLGVEERGVHLKYGRGSFGTDRALALWAPKGQAAETFGAAMFRRTDGFGPGVRGGQNGAMVAQYKLPIGSANHILFHAAAHAARSNVAGVLRRDDVDAGRVDFYDAYPDPSARAQSAAASRAQIGVSFERRQEDGARTQAAFWLMLASYRSRLNFTGYTERSRVEPTWVGRGDLVEQSNQDLGVGARAAYRSARYEPTEWVHAQLELGTEAKTNGIDQTQALLKAPQNETWDQRVDATVRASDLGVFVDGLVAGKKWVKLRGGVRGDLLVYDVDDRLGNFIPSFQKKSHIVGFRRTAAGFAWGPRASLDVDPLPFLQANIAYGEGFRSPQARQLEEGEQAPFAKVRSYEAGVTLHDEARVSLSAIAYETRLSYDLAFDPQEARLERVGPTTRRGLVGYLRGRPLPFLQGSISATYVHATLDSPPIATADNPSPPYREGQALPYVPPLVVRQDVSAEGKLADVFGHALVGKVGYATTFLSPRPLPYGQESRALFTVDALASLRRDFLELGLEATNILGARVAETEYAFVSNWRPNAVPSLLPARHITAGPPRLVMLTLGVHL